LLFDVDGVAIIFGKYKDGVVVAYDLGSKVFFCYQDSVNSPCNKYGVNGDGVCVDGVTDCEGVGLEELGVVF